MYKNKTESHPFLYRDSTSNIMTIRDTNKGRKLLKCPSDSMSEALQCPEEYRPPRDYFLQFLHFPGK